MTPHRTRRALLLALAALPGCSLVDQTTFNPNAGKRPDIPTPPAPPPGPAPEPGPPALLSIRVPITGDLRPDIAKAVAAARSRKPDVVFEVVEITPGTGTGVGADAAEVARLIIAQGIPASRVHLAARPVPNAAREVRVYVR